MTELSKIRAENTTCSTIGERLERIGFLTNGIEFLSEAMFLDGIADADIDVAAAAINAIAWELSVESIAIEEAICSYQAQ